MRTGSRVAVYGPQVGNSTDRRAAGPMSRVCPRCEAGIGRRCYRFVGAQQVPMKTVHKDRRTPRAPKGEDE